MDLAVRFQTDITPLREAGIEPALHQLSASELESNQPSIGKVSPVVTPVNTLDLTTVDGYANVPLIEVADTPMARKKLNPAQVVTQELGVRPLARLLGLDPKAIMRWKDRGLVPADYHRQVIIVAESQGVTITPTDLVHGRG